MSDIAPDVPRIPDEAVEFSKALASLAEEYGLREVEASIRIHTGVGSKYWNRIGMRENIVQEMHVKVSRHDGRGRPRTQISVTAKTEITVRPVWQQDSSD